MSGIAPGRPAAAMRCVGCAEPFGSEVPFCPFCGAAQRPAVVQVLRPVTASVPPTPPWAAPPATAAVPQPAPVAVEPKPVPKPTRKRSRWVFWLVAACLLVLGVEVLGLRQPGPVGSVVVRVRAPNGAAVAAGQVLVNNRPAGAPGETVTLPPGPATVGFQAPGWHTDPRTVSVAANAALTVDLVARELPGHLALTTTPPGAAVVAGARSFGRSPVSADLAPGPYELSVTLSGYVAKIVSVQVVHGETATIDIDLSPAPPRRTDAPFDHGVMARTAPLLSAPAAGSDVLAVLQPGTEVQVQARMLADTAWLQVRAGTRTGFVAPDSVESWDGWAQRNTVSGLIDTISPDLRVGIAGGSYPLAGVQPSPRGGPELARMSAVLLGSFRCVPARCVPHDVGSFVCRTADGSDVAERYLFNGCAVATDTAPAHYADLQRTARDQQRGVWAQ